MKLVRKGPTDKEQFEQKPVDVREQVMQERLGSRRRIPDGGHSHCKGTQAGVSFSETIKKVTGHLSIDFSC